MESIVVVADAALAGATIRWAGKLGRGKYTQFTVFSCFDGPPGRPRRVNRSRDEPLIQAVERALSWIRGYSTDHFELTGDDLPKVLLGEIERRHPEAVIVAVDGKAPPESLAYRLGERLMAVAPCNVMLLDPGETDGATLRELLVPLGSLSEAYALRRGVTIAERWGCDVVPMLVRPDKEGEVDIGANRELNFELGEAGVPVSRHVKPVVVPASDKIEAVLARGRESDLVVVGATSIKPLAQLRAPDPKTELEALPSDVAVGLFRRDVIRRSRLVNLLLGWIPEIKPEDRQELFEGLQRGARWNADFVVMMAVSTAIASLGLLQNSAAVVIGAMLVAPLMTPMIGSGLALVEGNLLFFQRTSQAMCYGIATALGVSAFFGFVTPGSDLTLELSARGAPNVLDLVVAFLSGAAAAYAMARPNILGAMAGVAIAAALVPPLATTGIALAKGHLGLSRGAGLLFVTNLVSIILGSAWVFNILGLRRSRSAWDTPSWVRRSLLVLILSGLALIAPLAFSMVEQLKQGQARPYYFPVSERVETAVRERVETIPDVDLVRIVRSGVERYWDIAIVLVAEKTISRQVELDLVGVVRETLGDPSIKVSVLAYLDAWEDL